MEALARAGLRNPVRINVASQHELGSGTAPSPGQKTPQSLHMQFLVCDSTAKLGQLVHFLLVRLLSPVDTCEGAVTWSLYFCLVLLFFCEDASELSWPQEHKDEKTIVYFLTCACVDLFATLLGRLPQTAGLPIAALHGRMKQAAREAALAEFAKQLSGMGAEGRQTAHAHIRNGACRRQEARRGRRPCV